MKKYYLHINGEQLGPFALDELGTQQIYADTPVWHDGLNDWLPAKSLTELNSIVLNTPPPYKIDSPSKLKPILEQTKEVGKFAGRFGKKTAEVVVKLALAVLIVSVAIVIFAVFMRGCNEVMLTVDVGNTTELNACSYEMSVCSQGAK